MNLFYQPRLQEGVNLLDGDEAHHAIRVFRLKVGDDISVANGSGVRALATITSIDKDSCQFKIRDSVFEPKETAVHIYVAPTKNTVRIEWLVEKATELGVYSINLVKCERSERKTIGHDRLMKVALSAMKQSQQSWLPTIRPLSPFEDILKNSYNQNFIAFVDQSNPHHLKNLAKPGKLQNYGLLIGPEGDFTDREVDLAVSNGWQKVSLGPTRLRTETAALTALVLLNNLEP